MKIILLENIEKVGVKGDVVNVKRGFARNYLVPRKHAIYATPANMGKLTEIKQVIAQQEEKRLNELKVLAEKLSGITLAFVRKVDENEHMFGSVSENDIVHELKAQGTEVHKAAILLEKHIKELGEFKVNVKLHKDITAVLNVIVTKEQE